MAKQKELKRFKITPISNQLKPNIIEIYPKIIKDFELPPEFFCHLRLSFEHFR